MKPLRFLILALLAPPAAAQAPSTVLSVDLEKLVSRGDITLDRPAPRREAGLPVGNGRMGSLVWTTPAAMHFQFNRVDVYASNRSSRSFFERDSDYGFGLGFLDLDFVPYGPPVFTGKGTRRHLSLYRGRLFLEGEGVKVQVFGHPFRDVVILEIDDGRETPLPVSALLRMLRPPRVRTRSHLALSRLEALPGGGALLTQTFTEGDYRCRSALALRFTGRPVQVRRADPERLRVTAAPGRGKFYLWISSAASMGTGPDPAGTALEALDSLAKEGFEKASRESLDWWRRFWSKGFVHLHSEDGEADYVEKHYTYYLYVMASSSRGLFPPRFGGMIFKTGGDFCRWGARHWFHNLSCYYRAVMESGRMELMEPFFRMYSGMRETCALAAGRYWGSEGLWIPETTGFDGPSIPPEDLAPEIRDLYLLRKPWEARSLRFREYARLAAPHDSPWNWKGAGRWVEGRWVYEPAWSAPFSYLVHIFTTTAKVAWFYWLRYEYTNDEKWLRDEAYPMLRGTAEFYRNFPNLRKERDGLYHIHDVNNHEPVRGAQDTMENLAAMKGILPLAILASEKVGADATLRPLWKDILDHLPPLPTNDDVHSLTPRKPGEPRFWTAGSRPYVGGRTDWGRLVPVVFYDLCTLENPDPGIHAIARNSFLHAFGEPGPGCKVHVLSRSAVAAALMGRGDWIRRMIPAQVRQSPGQVRRFIDFRKTRAGILENRMTLREGAEAIGIQRLGRASAALQYALLQSVPPAPGGKPVLRVFPAWPGEWEADFTLAARGGFLVTSSRRGGKTLFVEIRFLSGRECLLRNPWGKSPVDIFTGEKKRESLEGPLLRLRASEGETLLVLPGGTAPARVRRTVRI